MEIDRNLLKEFAKITNDSEVKSETKYLRGTIIKNSGGKYVQLDGSTTATPISELIDVDEGDRVLVSIENHKATIIGNFSFPPSARKEQEAIDKSQAAQESANKADTTANAAQQKAQEASEKADTAISQSSIASASADEAKEQATEAINKANAAQENVEEAKDLATQAQADAKDAKSQAAASQASSAEAQAEVTRLQGEVDSAQEDINKALDDLETQAGEIEAVKQSYATKVEVGNTKAELETTITTKVGELETSISETYSTKTENVELEGRLQSQITQNAEGLASQVTKTEKLESDTTKAQQDVANALAQASAAQTAATEAQNKANAAQTAADQASADASSATSKAQLAQNAADAATAAANAADQAVQEAQGDLNEAKQNLANVTSRVDATEAEIAEAQQKVDAAQTAVNGALADAAEARAAANNATEAANKAQQDAETAQGVANTAQQKADNAKEAADNAKEAADKAQADVAELTQRVITAETQISQNSEAITLNASKTEEIGTKVDNLEIGGRNYILKSNVFSSPGGAADGITPSIENKILKIVTTENNGNWHSWYKDNTIDSNFQTDDEFTFSIEIKCDEGSTGKPMVYFKTGMGYYAMIGNVTTEYSTLYYTGKWIDTNSINFHFGWDSAVGTFYIRKMKFEKGNKPTDWTPAPEDIESNLANNYYTKTETDAKIKVESDRITSTVTKVETVEKNAVISSVEQFYLSTSPTSLSGGSWSTTQPTWTEGKYIWRRTYVTKGDGTTSYQPSQNGVCITGNTGATGPAGADGKPGADGQPGAAGKDGVDGRGIVSTEVTYQGSTSGTTIPTGTWSTTIPTVAAGSYLWTRTITTYTSGNPTTAYSVGKMGNTGAQGPAGADGAAGKDGADGQPGVDGKDGKGIKSAVTTYQASASGTIMPTGTWSTSVPKTTSDKPYLWSRTIVTYTDDTTSTSYAVGATPEGITVGGRNYILDSANIVSNKLGSEVGSNAEYHAVNVGQSYMNIPHGTIVTFSFDLEMTVNTENPTLMVYNTNNHGPKWLGTRSLQFTAAVGETIKERCHVVSEITDRTDATKTDNYIEFYSTYGTSNWFSVSNFKLETGNKATDWSPAPEDVSNSLSNIETNLDTSIGDVNTNIQTIQSTITQLSNMISHLVTDENGGSLMTQTPDGWTFNMSSINGNLTAIQEAMENMSDEHNDTNDALQKLANLVNEVANKTAYINIGTDSNGDPCIELGKSDNDFKVRITNTAIDFMEGSSKIAYANNNTFYAEKMIVKNELQIGAGPGFVWRTRSNGNMGLVYISG